MLENVGTTKPLSIAVVGHTTFLGVVLWTAHNLESRNVLAEYFEIRLKFMDIKLRLVRHLLEGGGDEEDEISQLFGRILFIGLTNSRVPPMLS